MIKLPPHGSTHWFWLGWLVGGAAWAINGLVWSIFVLSLFRLTMLSFALHLTFYLVLGHLISYLGYRGHSFLFTAAAVGLAAATLIKNSLITFTAGDAGAAAIAVLLFIGILCAGFAVGIVGQEIRHYTCSKTVHYTNDRAA